jgi:hypothetical protein
VGSRVVGMGSVWVEGEVVSSAMGRVIEGGRGQTSLVTDFYLGSGTRFRLRGFHLG